MFCTFKANNDYILLGEQLMYVSKTLLGTLTSTFLAIYGQLRKLFSIFTFFFSAFNGRMTTRAISIDKLASEWFTCHSKRNILIPKCFFENTTPGE